MARLSGEVRVMEKNNVAPFFCSMYLSRSSYNPNVIDDLQKYVFPNYDKAELEEMMKELKRKDSEKCSQVIRYLDVLELIHHMKIVAEEAEIQKYVFHGQEIKGLDSDINSLIFYLTISAMDVMAPSSKGYEVFTSWIRKKENLEDYDYKTDIQQYLNSKYEEYRADNGMKSGLKKAIDGMDTDFKSKIVQNVSLLSVKTVEDLIKYKPSYDEKGDVEETYSSIINYCTVFRNLYTHDMYRIQKPLRSSKRPVIICKGDDLTNLFKGRNKKDVKLLIVNNGFDLENALLEISLKCCREEFGK